MKPQSIPSSEPPNELLIAGSTAALAGSGTTAPPLVASTSAVRASLSQPSAADSSAAVFPAVAIKAKIASRVQRIAHPSSGTGLLRYPEVTVANAEASHAINDSIARLRKSYYDPTDPADEDTSLVGMRFSIDHNGNGILSITFETEWNGAYPSGGVAHRCYWLATGEELAAARLIEPTKLEALIAVLDRLLQKEIAATRQRHQSERGWEDVKESFSVHFDSDSLKDFRVSSKGVSFYFAYDLPHAWKAWEPPGEFFLSFVDLEPFLAQAGPLSGMALAAKAARNAKQTR